MNTYKVQYAIHDYYSQRFEKEDSMLILFNGIPTNEEAEELVEKKIEDCITLDKFIQVIDITEIPLQHAKSADLSVAEFMELINYVMQKKSQA